MPVLFLLFLIVPLVELWAILQVGAAIGGAWTIAILVADSVLGAVIVRREGAKAWRSLREALQAGRWPGDEVAQGALVVAGGALLVTPGFVTDVVGLLAVLPPSRAVLSQLLRTRFAGAVLASGRASGRAGRRPPTGPADRSGTPPRPGPTDRSGPEVLDVEVVSVERDEPDELGRS
jgi:UPF0716 protein FxsA